MKENSNGTRNIKHVNFVPKDVQRILTSHKSIMNRKCSTRRLFLKVSQYSQENTFLIKMQAFRPSALLKRDSNTGAFCEHWEIFKSTYFEVHLWSTCEQLLLRVSLELFPTWTNSTGSEEDVFSKTKKQKPFEYSAIWKKLAFSYSLSFRFSLFLHFTSDGICPT